MKIKDRENVKNENDDEVINDDHIELTSDILLNHQFDIALSGYEPTEVDQFFDKVIKDYKTFQTKLDDKELEIKKLKEELAKYKSISSDEIEKTVTISTTTFNKRN